MLIDVMTKPFLYDIVNGMSHFVMDPLPQVIQERGMVSNFALGFSGIYSVVKILQIASRGVDKYIIPGFDEKVLPKLEKACIAGITAAPLLYAIVDPVGAREIMTQHPDYTSGMIGVYAGSVTAAVQDLHKRELRNKNIEDLVK